MLSCLQRTHSVSLEPGSFTFNGIEILTVADVPPINQSWYQYLLPGIFVTSESHGDHFGVRLTLTEQSTPDLWSSWFEMAGVINIDHLSTRLKTEIRGLLRSDDNSLEEELQIIFTNQAQ